jgi:alkanesulfonate monooxygenase SsuD/methylene tetrahydromethanopterin reductase-like flavin-dependent oxidoreductase (luciferase family)
MGLLPSPEEAAAYPYTEEDRALIEHATSSHLIGTADQVHEGLVELQRRTRADEIMLSTRAHSLTARIASLSLIAQTWDLVGA